MTRAPTAKDRREICSIDDARTIDVRVGIILAAIGSEFIENDREIDAVHFAITIEISGARAGNATFTAVRNVVRVQVFEFACEDLSVVDDGVVVAVSGPFDDARTADNVTCWSESIVDVIKKVVAAARKE